MGFRQGSWATIFDVRPKSDRVTSVRLSTSKKSRMTGEYEQDFGGYVSFLGTAVAAKAARLKPMDRIKLGEVEVTNKYDKTKQCTYTNFSVFSFETREEASGGAQPASNSFQPQEVDGGEEPELPF